MHVRGVRSAKGRSTSPTYALARALGWFSIALGAAEIAAPGLLARTLGMQGKEQLLRAYGAREVAAGIGVLASSDPTPWLWGRAAGDALDIATLGTSLRRDNPKAGNVGLALAAVAGITALDVMCAVALGRSGLHAETSPRNDYGARSGFPRAAEAMRGAARDFEAPRDFRTPELLRPRRIG